MILYFSIGIGRGLEIGGPQRREFKMASNAQSSGIYSKLKKS
jgi:hypothetical protein